MTYQKVLSPFKDVNKVLSQLVRDCMKPESDIEAVLELDNDEETASLTFQQKTEFRTDDLLTLIFKESKPETIKQSISYRISRTKELNNLCKNRIMQIANIVEARNKTLMDEIRKGAKFTDDIAAMQDLQIRIDTSLWVERKD